MATINSKISDDDLKPVVNIITSAVEEVRTKFVNLAIENGMNSPNNWAVYMTVMVMHQALGHICEKAADLLGEVPVAN